MKTHLAALAMMAAVFAAFTMSVRAQDQSGSAKPFDVTIQGQVLKPGHYSVTADLTVIDAIELAGGFTVQALRSTVKITRAPKAGGTAQTTTLDYSDFALNNNNAQFKLQPGDVIFIPADPTYGK